MRLAQRQQISFDEFVRFENAADARHEWIGGEIVARAGASDRHSDINFNLSYALGPIGRKAGCRIRTSDQRLDSEATGQLFYPDLMVVCPGSRTLDDAYGTLLEPKLLAEITSPTTVAVDRKTRLQAYLRFSTLREYLIVDGASVSVEHYSRSHADEMWRHQTCEGPDAMIVLASLEGSIALSDLYFGIAFES
jgi:Uma2 family endonuclease